MPSLSEPRQRNNLKRRTILTRTMTSPSPLSTPCEITWAPHKKLCQLSETSQFFMTLLRYVTETKYLIDLVPTQKETVSDKPATEAIPEQSSSSSTASSSETEDEGDNAVQDLADGEHFKQMEIDYKGTEGTRGICLGRAQGLPSHCQTGRRPAVGW